jgi:hypothetical protein
MSDNRQKLWVYGIVGAVVFILLILIARRIEAVKNSAITGKPISGGLQNNPMFSEPNPYLFGKNGYPMVTPDIINLPATQLNFALNNPSVNMSGWSGAQGFGGDTSIYVPLFGFVGYTDYALY